MSILVNITDLSKSYGSKDLFKNLSFSVLEGDRIGLIGPNGAGKSTLLKIIAKLESSDEGEIVFKRFLKIGYVPQNISYGKMSVKEVLLRGLLSTPQSDYDKELIVDKWLSKVGFEDNSLDASTLSGGWQKRLSIAEALVCSPDLLLLDEPTNHLDLQSIIWLETFLKKNALNFILISHDRYFLQNICNKIIEISPVYPDYIFVSKGGYLDFLKSKNNFLDSQVKQEKSLGSKARRELEWLRQGVKARTTKSRSRINEAYDIFDKLENIKKRNIVRKAKIDFSSTNRQTKKLITLEGVSKSINGRLLFNNLSITLSPSSKVGVIGPNGSGKTTLLKMITKELVQDKGIIKEADNLKIVYFDQHRKKLDDNLTLKEALCSSGEYVLFQNSRIHVNSWCQRFLFSKDLLNAKLKTLSGGERARISIANLLLQPADILLLDEPTNDLDIETLDVLEESLSSFSGAIVLITHDRFLMEKICNSIISLDNNEKVEIFSDYAQYESHKEENKDFKERSIKPKNIKTQSSKMSYLEKKEYEQMEDKITLLEKEISVLNDELHQNELISDTKKIEETCKQLSFLENQIEALYSRWEELENKK